MNILQAISRLLIKKEKIKQNSEATEGKTNMKPTDPVHSLSAKAGPQYSHWPACANSALTVCFAETEASQEPYAQ